ncbi:ATPase [Sporolituus thermophilus]|uniref:ATPase n=1 Tax=Sporolituus thermophilus DSM 23256 TaxID=1123285 RepID=A0A1G7NUP7_9FIRM|nr:ATPase [Sporolituus thermophilus]SDF76930.1 hypothetical protein SAMN05660235_02683 [Sporolituus thermophilus DSM 23256]
MKTIEILDEMENLLVEAAKVPFTNKLIIEEDDLGRLMDELRETVPGEIVEAKRILAERQRILDEAQREAQTIIEQAKSYILKLTDENIITRQAQEQANEIIQQAQKEARELHNQALIYASEVFKQIEANLEKALEVIRQGHGSLQQSRHE